MAGALRMVSISVPRRFNGPFERGNGYAAGRSVPLLTRQGEAPAPANANEKPKIRLVRRVGAGQHRPGRATDVPPEHHRPADVVGRRADGSHQIWLYYRNRGVTSGGGGFEPADDLAAVNGLRDRAETAAMPHHSWSLRPGGIQGGMNLRRGVMRPIGSGADSAARDELVAQLADTAEAGYDVEGTLRRRGGRPPIGSAAASVESVRLDPELGRALTQRAERGHEPTSSVIRKALRRYLQAGQNRTPRRLHASLSGACFRSPAPAPRAPTGEPGAALIDLSESDRRVLEQSAPAPELTA